MRLLVVLTLLVSGCATRIPTTYQQHCALKGMKLTGVTDGSGSQFVAHSDGSYATGSSSNQKIHCAVPQIQIDKCEAERLRKTTLPIQEYNDSVNSKRTWAALGYFFYIVPGIIVTYSANKQKKKALASYHELDSSLSLCAAENKSQ